MEHTLALVFRSQGVGVVDERRVELDMTIRGKRSGDPKTPSDLEVTTWNPSDRTIDQLLDPDTLVSVEADGVEVFAGSVLLGTYSSTWSEDSDREVSFTLSQASVAFEQVVPTLHFPGASTTRQVLAAVASALGLAFDDQGIGQPATYNDATFGGSLDDVLRTLGSDSKSRIVPVQGRLVVRPLVVPATLRIPSLDRASGLVGSPTRTDYGWTVRTLLQGNLGPGSLVRVSSSEYVGPLLVVSLTIDASTVSDAWFMDLECILPGERRRSASGVVKGRTTTPSVLRDPKPAPATVRREEGRGAAAVVRVACTALVLDVDAAGGRVLVRPLASDRKADGWGGTEVEPVGEFWVPLMQRVGSRGYGLRFPLQAGARVQVHVRDRDHSHVNAGSTSQQSSSERRWDWSDAFAVLEDSGQAVPSYPTFDLPDGGEVHFGKLAQRELARADLVADLFVLLEDSLLGLVTTNALSAELKAIGTKLKAARALSGVASPTIKVIT